MCLGPPPDHKHLDRGRGARFSGGLWRRVGSVGAAEGGARISILVFLLRHRYRDTGRLDGLAIVAGQQARPGLRQEQTSRRTSIKSILAGFVNLCAESE